MLFNLQRFCSIKRDRKVIMNSEQVRIWIEVIMTCLKVISWHLSGENEEIHKSSVRIASNPADI